MRLGSSCFFILLASPVYVCIQANKQEFGPCDAGVLGESDGLTSPKIHHPDTPQRKKLTWMLCIAGLCCFFYILGSWQNNDNVLGSLNLAARDGSTNTGCSNTMSLDFGAHHTEASSTQISSSITVFPPCDMKYSEYTPCEDTERSLNFPREMLIYRDRHCPEKHELLQCLIPAPPNYKNPLPWPTSRDYTWFANTPHKELTVEKAVQKWVQFHGEKLYFPGGGTFSAGGADKYISDIGELIPLDDGTIRTAIDTGCGVRDPSNVCRLNYIIPLVYACIKYSKKIQIQMHYNPYSPLDGEGWTLCFRLQVGVHTYWRGMY
jgi:hypothetical protein